MERNSFQRIRIVFVAVIVAAAFVPLLLTQVDGPDFPNYFLWAKAFNERNIFALEGGTLSPQGVPFSQYSFGPGLIFSLGGILGSFTPEDAKIIGWLFTIIFWISYVGILLHVTNNNRSLTLFGACVTFIGTPLGYYSSAYSSESLSYTCLSVMLYWLLSHDKLSVFDYLLVGIWSSLLIVIRSQLVLYVLPVYIVVLYRIAGEIRSASTPLRWPALGAVMYHVPIITGIAAISTVNAWMTGSPFTSVYTFGSGEFKSIDFLHPELMAVLVHPWHGLITYHPLYLLGFAALCTAVFTQRTRPQTVVLAVTLLAILLHLYLHASWYVWWLGQNTFGMRGLSICAIILIPLLLKSMSGREGRGESNSALFILILCMNLWSFILLTQGPTAYYSYQQLISGVSSAIENLVGIHFIFLPALVFGLGAFATLIYRPLPAQISLKHVVTMVLFLLVIQFHVTKIIYDRFGMLAVSFLSLGISILILKSCHAVIDDILKYSQILQKVFLASSVAVYVVLIVLFVNLSFATNRITTYKNLPIPHTFSRIGTVDIDEVSLSLEEYLNVPGFEGKKAGLKKYLEELNGRDYKTLDLR